MFIDFEPSSESDASVLDADLCIIGSGAAGITLALEFVGQGTSVLLIESGGQTPDDRTTALYESSMAAGGKHHFGTHDGRARVFGGTTTLWGGQALPLADLDFAARDWVPNSGWPFGSEELVPYYQRAGKLLGLHDVEFTRDIHAAFGIRRFEFDSSVVTPIYSRWAPQPNFATTYRQRLASAENIRVLLRANAVEIVPDPGGTRIEGVRLCGLGGRTATARGKFYVVCCGGIETARLLLASSRVQPAGVGNTHDLVGRYFQDHLSVRWADFQPSSRQRVNDLFNSFFCGRTKYFPFLAAGEEVQRREHLLNISAAVVFDPVPDTGVELAKRVARSVAGRRWREVSVADGAKLLSGLPEVAHFAWRLGVQRRSYFPACVPLMLGSTIEQEPSPVSRVRLGTKTDALGMQRAVVDWQLTPAVLRTLRLFAQRLRAEFLRVGLGQVLLHPWVLDDEADWIEKMRDVSHHIGTTRMHVDPRQGVVDARCRVHGLENLYVGSSAVFPTGGHSNPTFTLLLLCLRLADHLKKTLR